MAKKSDQTAKARYTRAEVVAAVAGVYRQERAEYHRLAERAREASYRGEAALYALCDEEAVKQEVAVKAVRRVAAALGIGDQELHLAAADGEEASK